MDKLKLTGRTLGQVFNSRSGCMSCHELTAPVRSNLELKTPPKKLLGSLPLDIALPHNSKLYSIRWFNKETVKN